jgi:hypothetical protein
MWDMKALLVGGLMLSVTWVGSTEPSGAMPLQLAGAAETASPLLVPVRHHHHHRWHRHHGDLREYDASDSDTPAGEGQTSPLPAAPPPAGDRGDHSGTATRPSIRWANPDRPTH